MYFVVRARVSHVFDPEFWYGDRQGDNMCIGTAWRPGSQGDCVGRTDPGVKQADTLVVRGVRLDRNPVYPGLDCCAVGLGDPRVFTAGQVEGMQRVGGAEPCVQAKHPFRAVLGGEFDALARNKGQKKSGEKKKITHGCQK